MKIRLLKKEDIKPAVIIVGKNHTKKHEKIAQAELVDMFQKGPIRPTYFVAEDEGKILGFAGYIQSWIDYDVYEIFWVNVLPEYQKQGIGKKLVAKVISEIKKQKKIGLIILSANIPNSKYYAKYFKFKTVVLFNKKRQHLMALAI